ncbi:LOW QUALITY PROTEIN: uncharacterized protein ACR2FA_002288 [Aphomia sociella]
MSSNGVTTPEETDMGECDGEKVVTMMDVLQEQQEFEEDANAVLGASDDKNCTYPKGYIKRQAIYACLTCCDAKTDPAKRAGVCLACSLMCHENHELVELYTKRNFSCDCGNPKFNSHPCQFTPKKIDLNENNNYNQNFSGLYCICHRPYPDPDSPFEDEMIQCIICEDWLHASHLEAPVPANEHYSEMICKACMEKNDFLHDYSNLAVNNECGDVDVVTINNDVNISSRGTAVTNGKLDKEINVSGDIDMTEMEDKTTNKNIEDEIETEIQKSDEGKTVVEPVDTVMKDIEAEASTIVPEALNSEQEKLSSMKDIEAEASTTVPEALNSEQEKLSNMKDQPLDDKKNTDSIIHNDEINEVKHDEALAEPDKSCSDDIAQTNSEVNNDSSEKANVTSVIETNNDNNLLDNEITSESNLHKQENNILSDSSKINDVNEAFDENSEQNKESTTENTKQNIENLLENITQNDEPISMDSEQVDNNKVEETSVANKDLSIRNDSTTNIPVETIETPKGNDESNLSETTAEIKDDNKNEVDNTVDNTNISENTNVDPKDLNEPNDVDMIEAPNKHDVFDTNKENTIKTATELETPNNTDSLVNSNLNENESINEEKHENKRKISEESLQETSAKKPKLEEIMICVRPKGVKKVFKGATFWPSNFRQKLCTCNECISMYKDLSVLLIDYEDTVTAYEALGKERTDGNSVSQYEKGLQALSSLDRIQQINALTEYNKMRDKLLDFLQSFKDRKEIVKEEDIKAFFAGIKAKREPDGVYFCR